MTAPKSILLDNDFLSDMKVQAILAEYGAEGIGYYVHVLTRMNDEKGIMPKRGLLRLGRMIGATDVTWARFLALCVTENLLSESGDNYILKRIVDDCKNVELKRKKWRDKKKKQRDVPGDTKGTSPGMSEEEEEPEEEKEDLLKNSHPTLTAATERWQFAGDLAHPLIKEWAPKVREKLFRMGRTWGQFELDAAVSNHGVEAVIAAMRFTCTLTNPKNLCFPDGNKTRDGPRKSQAQRNQDDSLEAMRIVLEEAAREN